MPSKKKKYNARFPAGRIKKIMQTDEEVGKVAQAVPVIISRTLELFVESLLVKATQVTTARNAKTLSPSHLKQCILREQRFDFLRDLVKNVPDVSAAEERELLSAENSPNSSSHTEQPALRRAPARDEPNSSGSTTLDTRHLTSFLQHETLKRGRSASSAEQLTPAKVIKTETITSTVISTAAAMDLTKKPESTIRTANFYQETLPDDDVQHSSVIRVNPTYSSNPQPSTSQYATLTTVQPTARLVDMPKKVDISQLYNIDLTKNTSVTSKTPQTPVTPVINIDFTKNLSNPEIHVLDTGSFTVPINVQKCVRNDVLTGSELRKRLEPPKRVDNNKHSVPQNFTVKALSRSASQEHRRVKESRPPVVIAPPDDIDKCNTGNLEIDEDYDT